MRESLALSQAGVAERAGISIEELDELEKGERDPTWELGEQLATQGLGIPLSAVAAVSDLLDKGLIELAAEPGSGAGGGSI